MNIKNQYAVMNRVYKIKLYDKYIFKIEKGCPTHDIFFLLALN